MPISPQRQLKDELGGGLIRFHQVPTRPRAVVYVIHGNNGNVENLRHIAAAGKGVEIVGISAAGVRHASCVGNTCVHGDQTVAEMADRYAREIAADMALRSRTTSLNTKFVVGGYSGGGIVALEVAEILLCPDFGLVGSVSPEVVLLDALPPHLTWPSAANQYRQAMTHLRSRPGLKTAKSLMPWLARSTANRTTRRVFRSAEQRRSEQVAKELGFSNFTERGLVDLESHIVSMLSEHPSSTYQANVLLVASAPLWPMFPPGYEWQRYANQVRTVVVPGDHHTMALPANAGAFMEVFEGAILEQREEFLTTKRVPGEGEVRDEANLREAGRVGAIGGSLVPVKVSIVIATFNRRGTVGQLLGDLEAQQFLRVSPSEIEVIVVNDGGNVDVEAELPSDSLFPITVLNRSNGGPAAARHSGIERSTGETVVILDDDMRIGSGFLDAHIEKHEEGAHVVYGLIQGDADTGPLFGRFHQGHIDRWLEECRAGAVPRGERLCTGNVSFRRQDYDLIGGFDRSLVRCEDRDLGIRLELAGVQFQYSEAAVSTHHSEHADVGQWRTRSTVYGESDVSISRKHKDHSELSPWSFLTELPTIVHPLLIAVAALPVLGGPVGFVVYRFGELLDKVGVHGAAIKLAGLTYGVDYYRGAGRRWGGVRPTLDALRSWRRSVNPT
jgi:GT2 family glycosyltransferase/thioesterase domain-containing protein